MSQLTLGELKEIVAACSGADEAVDLSSDVADADFPELGYDSLAVLEIVTQIQRRYGLAIPDEVIETITSPNSLLEYVNNSLTGA